MSRLASFERSIGPQHQMRTGVRRWLRIPRRLPGTDGPRRWRARYLGYGAALLLAALLVLALLPVPALDAPLTKLIADRVASQSACPGSLAQPPEVTIGGGRLLPQLLRRRLSEVRLVLPDTAIGGAEHAAFAATLREVSQPEADAVHAGSIDATITIKFADMPGPPDGPPPVFGRAPDGSLTVQVVPDPEAAKNVRATLFMKMELGEGTVSAVPQRLRLFGKTLPAAQVKDLAGGARTEKLPEVPDGVVYRSVTPRKDGLHVAVGGVATTPFRDLPAEVDGQAVTYSANNGQLGISTSRNLPLIGDLPLTIFTEPRIERGTLRLVPRSVTILGRNRPPDDLIAKVVLDQVKQESLSRKLPTLPPGVTYRSASVDGSGLKVALDGVTVRSYSQLPAKQGGRPATYGAQNGLMTVTTRGTGGARNPIVLYSKPRITGSTLDLAPQQIEMFGILFPARNVLAEVDSSDTAYPLQALPTNLAYRGVEVLPDGLRISMSGKDVTLRKGALGSAGC